MTDIPQVADQFTEERDPVDAAPPRYVASLTGRFPIYVSDEVCLDELRQALNAAGFAMHGDVDRRWCVDKVHAIALVHAANEPEASEAAMWPHDCPVEQMTIYTARGQRCSWCGATEPEGENA